MGKRDMSKFEEKVLLVVSHCLPERQRSTHTAFQSVKALYIIVRMLHQHLLVIPQRASRAMIIPSRKLKCIPVYPLEIS